MATGEVIFRRSSFWRGSKRAFSIVLGYLPIGLAYGMIATEYNLDPLVTMALSIMVFAGSSQFVAVSMLATGGGGLPLIISVFFINLRHLLMSASLAPFLRNTSLHRLFLLGFGITDESFAVLRYDFEEGVADADYMMGVNLTAYLSWNLATFLGIILGGLMIKPQQLGLDFALPAMFIALLVYQLRGRLFVLVALLAGLFSLCFTVYVPEGWNLILAAFLAATLGVLLKRWRSFY